MELDLFDILCEGLGLYKALWMSIYILGLGIIATIFKLIHFKRKDKDVI